MFVRFLAGIEGLEGNAAPMVEGDNLDVTSTSSGGSSASTNSIAGNAPIYAKPASSGLSLMTKLFYASVILAVCVVFVKTRRDRNVGFREKNYA